MLNHKLTLLLLTSTVFFSEHVGLQECYGMEVNDKNNYDVIILNDDQDDTYGDIKADSTWLDKIKIATYDKRGQKTGTDITLFQHIWNVDVTNSLAYWVWYVHPGLNDHAQGFFENSSFSSTGALTGKYVEKGHEKQIATHAEQHEKLWKQLVTTTIYQNGYFSNMRKFNKQQFESVLKKEINLTKMLESLNGLLNLYGKISDCLKPEGKIYVSNVVYILEEIYTKVQIGELFFRFMDEAQKLQIDYDEDFVPVSKELTLKKLAKFILETNKILKDVNGNFYKLDDIVKAFSEEFNKNASLPAVTKVFDNISISQAELSKRIQELKIEAEVITDSVKALSKEEPENDMVKGFLFCCHYTEKMTDKLRLEATWGNKVINDKLSELRADRNFFEEHFDLKKTKISELIEGVRLFLKCKDEKELTENLQKIRKLQSDQSEGIRATTIYEKALHNWDEIYHESKNISEVSNNIANIGEKGEGIEKNFDKCFFENVLKKIFAPDCVNHRVMSSLLSMRKDKKFAPERGLSGHGLISTVRVKKYDDGRTDIQNKDNFILFGGRESAEDTYTIMPNGDWIQVIDISKKGEDKISYKLHITALPWSLEKVVKIVILSLYDKDFCENITKNIHQNNPPISSYINVCWEKLSQKLLDGSNSERMKKLRDIIQKGVFGYKFTFAPMGVRRMNYITFAELGHNYKNLDNSELCNTQIGKNFVIYSTNREGAKELIEFGKKLDNLFNQLVEQGYLSKEKDFMPLQGDAMLGNSGAVWLREESGHGEIKDPNEQTAALKGMAVRCFPLVLWSDQKQIDTQKSKFPKEIDRNAIKTRGYPFSLETPTTITWQEKTFTFTEKNHKEQWEEFINFICDAYPKIMDLKK